MAYVVSCKDVNADCGYYAQADTLEEAKKVVTGHFQNHWGAGMQQIHH